MVKSWIRTVPLALGNSLAANGAPAASFAGRSAECDTSATANQATSYNQTGSPARAWTLRRLL